MNPIIHKFSLQNIFTFIYDLLVQLQFSVFFLLFCSFAWIILTISFVMFGKAKLHKFLTSVTDSLADSLPQNKTNYNSNSNQVPGLDTDSLTIGKTNCYLIISNVFCNLFWKLILYHVEQDQLKFKICLVSCTA